MQTDDIITNLYGSHNEAAQRGVMLAAEKVASEYGDEGLGVFEQWLDQVPADAIFDLEQTPEKTASETDKEVMDKIAEADFLGTVMFQSFQRAAARHEKMAEFVSDKVYEAFLADCTEQPKTDEAPKA